MGDTSADCEYNVDKEAEQFYTMPAPRTFDVDDLPPAGGELDEEESVKKNHQFRGDGSFTWLWKITIVKNKAGIRQLFQEKVDIKVPDT